MQLEFQIITRFGHALPHSRHSGQFWYQSAYWISSYHKKILTQTDGRTDDGRHNGQTNGRTETIGSFFQQKQILKTNAYDAYEYFLAVQECTLEIMLVCIKKKFATCVNLQLSIVSLKKSIILDIHPHNTYMYINFQQNRVNRSVITVHTNVFAKKSQLA